LASKKFVLACANGAACPQQKAELLGIANDSAKYVEFILKGRRSPVEVLARFSSVSLSLSDLIRSLPQMKLRYYSISSSPLKHPAHVHLTVAVVSYTVAATGITHGGLCSSYLASLSCGDEVFVAVEACHPSWSLPNLDTHGALSQNLPSVSPVIMIGPGTGVAPFRGFLQEVDSSPKLKAKVQCHLFFGCRNENDHIYKDEWSVFLNCGVLKSYSASFSRPTHTGQSKCYVQDTLMKHQDAVWELISAGAKIMVCGDGNAMAPSVKNQFIEIIQACSPKTAVEAKQQIANMQSAGKYVEDVWTG